MPTWRVGANRNLPTSDSDAWDGGAAAASIFAWAGGDEFSSEKARQGFLVYDASADDLRGSYKLPFARVIDGTLTAVKGGINAAASRLPQTDIPEDVMSRARAVIDSYQAKLERASARKIEYRVVDAEAAPDGSGMDGYAALWWTVDTYGTAWKPGAFKKSIDERGSRIPVLWAHDPDRPIGRVTALTEDRKGLKFSARIVEQTQAGAETMALLREDVPLGMSFGFKTIRERPPKETEWDRLSYAGDTDYFQTDEGKPFVRIKEETALWEVSPVTFAANDATYFTDVRAAVEADAITTITEAIRAGTLDERTAALVDDLVAAWGERAGPADTPPTPDRARRDTDIRIAIAQLTSQYGQLLGAQA